jgi:hypothetical protein
MLTNTVHYYNTLHLVTGVRTSLMLIYVSELENFLLQLRRNLYNVSVVLTALGSHYYSEPVAKQVVSVSIVVANAEIVAR